MNGSVNGWYDNDIPELCSLAGKSFLFAVVVGIVDMAVIHFIMDVFGVFDNIAIYG